MNKSFEENPWKILGSTVIYDNPWIKLVENQVITPSGQDSVYAVVKYKHKAIGVIPVDDEMNVWLVGQWRFPLNRYSWEIPEGGGRMNEDPLEAAKRELLEECGIVAGEWTPLMEFYTSNSVADEHAIVFVAKKLQFKNSQPEPDEILQVKKLSFHKVYEMVMDGIITDSISIAAILKLKCLIDEGKF